MNDRRIISCLSCNFQMFVTSLSIFAYRFIFSHIFNSVRINYFVTSYNLIRRAKRVTKVNKILHANFSDSKIQESSPNRASSTKIYLFLYFSTRKISCLQESMNKRYFLLHICVFLESTITLDLLISLFVDFKQLLKIKD